jgi:hypothetical protein
MPKLLAPILVALALALPATALAEPPIVGIGEQSPEIFTDPNWLALNVPDVRVVASYDALTSTWQRNDLDTYMAAAHAAGARVLLSFGHSRIEGKEHYLPTVQHFANQFRAFRARYPWVTNYLTWNEADHCSQPTCKRPERAAQYYLAIRRICPSCTIVAADVLDGSKMLPWVKRFQKAVGPNRKLIWGLHNYIDANRFRSVGTRSLLKAVKGDIWFTETGGLVMRRNGSTVAFPGSTRHAAQTTDYVFKLAALSPRIKRVYLYQWLPAGVPDPTWDSALVDSHDRPRPAYDVLRKWLARHPR